jgi:hypothetical protein
MTSNPIVKPPSSEQIGPFGKTINFWNPVHFNFTDALNEDIWNLSPEVQHEVHPIDSLMQPGVIGAQQAMLDGDILAKRGPLPWVPDLVGQDWQNESGIVIVGSAYAGFIREYSTRVDTMPLNQYLAATSVKDFQELFLRYVVREDHRYYVPIQNLCSDLCCASRLSLLDLCRASLVKRGLRDGKHFDSSSSRIFKEDPAVFAKYVEAEQSAEWLWRRFVEGQAKCVLALGFTSEHGLLRLFAQRGMTVTQGKFSFCVKPCAKGAWANKYANSGRTLGFWLRNKTWWNVRGQVNGVKRVWYVLPIYHPAQHGNYDPQYRQTKLVLKLMLASIDA